MRRLGVFVSQPSCGLPLQSAHPAAHADPEKEHWPAAVHVVAPLTFGRFVQSFVHEPQWCTSVTETQAPPHEAKPAVQTHLPALQAEPVVHAAAHPPQFALSVCSFTQTPLHDVKPASQTHLPAEQTCPAAHAAPQPPQLFASLW